MINIEANIGRLRSLQHSDAVSLSRYANNKKIWDNLRDFFPHPYTPEHAAQFIAMAQDASPPQHLAIDLDGECIGVAGFYAHNDVYRLSADFGYWIGEPFWGKGIASAIIPLMVDYIFQHFEIIRLQPSVFEFNAASMRVLEKAGFTKECIARKAVIKNGRLVDEHRYYLLKPGIE